MAFDARLLHILSMRRKPNEFKFVESPSQTKHSSYRTSTACSPSKVPLPPLARRQAKVDWTEVMSKRQMQTDQEITETISFYYDKAFESPEHTSNQRFFSKNSTEETQATMPSPSSIPRRNKAKLSESAEFTLQISESHRSNTKLAFSFSLIDRIDEIERSFIEDADKAETLDKIKKEHKTWVEVYGQLDGVLSSQERAVSARRIAHNSQKLLCRMIDLHEQHTQRCSKYAEDLKEVIVTLKREVMLALKLREALVVNSMDRERMEKEIEEMFGIDDDFNYESFTTSARRLLEKGESQLTHNLIEAYKELAKERQLPRVHDPDISLSSLGRWETEMKLKFT
jgi:hypothetical protein